MQPKLIFAILCGGAGSRLWPVVSRCHPKPLMKIGSGDSLLNKTLYRTRDWPEAERVLICGAEHSQALLADLALDTAAKPLLPPIGTVIIEPQARDTAAAIAAICAWADKEHGPDDVLIILPSDHGVGDETAFCQAINIAIEVAQKAYIATLGIVPDSPATAYGYIKAGSEMIPTALYPDRACKVERFVEKPDLNAAENYVEQGGYYWNAGIFVAQIRTLCQTIQDHAPDILVDARQAFLHAETAFATSRTSFDDLRLIRLNNDYFQSIRRISVDYAVMEKSERLAIIPAEFPWTDFGDWASIARADAEKVDMQDCLSTLDAQGNFVRTTLSHVGMIGVNDLVVVESGGNLLICSKFRTQDVKHIAQTAMHKDEARVSRLKAAKIWASEWLFDKALPLWAHQGVDSENGSALEALSRSARGRHDLPKRFLVQARQMYTFAKAVRMGWAPGLEQLRKISHYVDVNFAHSDGGWIHKLQPDGAFLDDRIDTYDQAFALLAFNEAYLATRDPQYIERAQRTLNYLNAQMTHPKGGYIEGSLSATTRRANPHMHLFEAALHWLDSGVPLAGAKELAESIYALFEKTLCVNGLLREHFSDDWTLIDQPNPDNYDLVEPGHLVEWAYLIRKYDDLFGTKSVQPALFEGFVDRFGLHLSTGLLIDYCHANGQHPEQITSRLWPQTEYIRLKLLSEREEDRMRALDMLDRLREVYLRVDGRERGHWIDQVDGYGQQIGKRMPASSFYHIIGCLERLV